VSSIVPPPPKFRISYSASAILKSGDEVELDPLFAFYGATFLLGHLMFSSHERLKDTPYVFEAKDEKFKKYLSEIGRMDIFNRQPYKDQLELLKNEATAIVIKRKCSPREEMVIY
jgi:hypothetical protein